MKTVTISYEEFKKMEKNAEIGQFVTDHNEKKKELERREKAVSEAEGKIKVVEITYTYTGLGCGLPSRREYCVSLTEIEEKGMKYDDLKISESNLRKKLDKAASYLSRRKWSFVLGQIAGGSAVFGGTVIADGFPLFGSLVFCVAILTIAIHYFIIKRRKIK